MLKSEWKAQPMQPCVMHVVLVPVQFVGRLRVKRGSYRWSQLASTSGSSCWKETTERTLELTSLVSGLTGGSVWGLAMTSQVCCCWCCALLLVAFMCKDTLLVPKIQFEMGKNWDYLFICPQICNPQIIHFFKNLNKSNNTYRFTSSSMSPCSHDGKRVVKWKKKRKDFHQATHNKSNIFYQKNLSVYR